jgi:hypothetical protein
VSLRSLGQDAAARHTVLQRVTDAPCVLHERHAPRCLVRVRHTVFPEFLQLTLWGEVREPENVPLCPTGAMNVLLATVDLLFGAGWQRSYTADERRYALLAFDRWQTAAAAEASAYIGPGGRRKSGARAGKDPRLRER